MADVPGRPRPNLDAYELRCGEARVPLVEIWKSCRGFPAPGGADADLPFTEGELRRARRRASGDAPPASSSCEVVPVATQGASSGAPGDASPEALDQSPELTQLLRALVFSSTVAEGEGCLTAEARAFKKLLARRRPDLFATLAREATPAGRLYGLCALRRRGGRLYRALKSDVARSPRTVVLLDGCTPRALPLGDALAPPAAPRGRSQFDAACDELQAAVAGGADCPG